MVPFKPSIHRIFFIDREIRANSFPSTVSLAQDYRKQYGIKVNPRTIAGDIADLKMKFHAPLGYDHQKRGYFYRDPDFRLPELQHGLEDLFPAMERVLRTTTADLPPWQQTFLSSLVDKVLPLPSGRAMTSPRASVLLNSPRPKDHQTQIWTPLLHSLEKSAVLEIEYNHEGKKPVLLRFSPIHLIFGPGMNLAFGLDMSSSPGRYVLLYLDRIKRINARPDGSPDRQMPATPSYIQVQTTQSDDLEVILSKEHSDLLLVFALPPNSESKTSPEYVLLAQTELFTNFYQ